MTDSLERGIVRRRALSPAERRSNRSGTLAAVLSFLFPGLGQGYLRHAELALVFAMPVIALLVIVALQLTNGIVESALRLLDPTIALAATAVIVLLGLWRALSVVHAWRAARNGRRGVVLVTALLVVIATTHAVGAYYTWSFKQAGERIFASDMPLDTPTPVPGWEPVLGSTPTEPVGPSSGAGSPLRTSSSSTGRPGDPTGEPSPQPLDPDEPPEQDPENEPEPTIEPGPPPAVPPEALGPADDGLLNVLTVGLDWVEGRQHAHTDSMIVTSVNSQTGDVLMFSFPRDIAGFPLYDGGTFSGRLNTFAQYAARHPERYPDGAMVSLSRQIAFLLGIPIDHYAAVNLPGFKSLVELVGGVTVHNPTPIADRKNDLYLSAGEHRLDAVTALKYVRSRYGPGNSDFMRARRQQGVLAALRRELLRPNQLGQLPARIDALSRVLNTNYPPSRIGEALQLADLVSKEPTGSWVFGLPRWAWHPPMSETGGRWIIRLRLDELAALSRELFDSRSLYNR